MRAVVATCKRIALAFALVGAVGAVTEAQTPQAQTSDARPVPAGSRAGYAPNGARVQKAQFEEIVPAPAAELNIAPGLNEAIGEVVAESNGVMAPQQPIVNGGVVSEFAPSEFPRMEAPLVETPLMETPVVEYPTVADPVFDSGQPYDLPIGDVIPEATEVYSTNNWFRGGTWYSRQDFMMLLRTDLSPVHFAVDTTNFTATGANIQDPFVVNSMSSQDGDFTYEAGTRLTLGKMLGRDVANRDHAIEFTFMGLFEYTGRASIEPSNPLAGTGINTLLGSSEVFSIQSGITGGFPIINNIEGFTNSLVQEFLYTADFNSFEMNYLVGGRPQRDRLVMQPDGRWSRMATPSKVRGFYVGLRYIRQNESFRYQGIGRNRAVRVFEEQNGAIVFQQDDNGDFTIPVLDATSPRLAEFDDSGTYRVSTDNDLFGLQFGGDVVAKRTDWAFGVNGKIGGLINFADRRSTLFQRFETLQSQSDRINNVNPTNDPEGAAVFETRNLEESLNDETLTFLSEVNVYVAYYLKPNTSVRFGYNALYLNGMAAALDNAGLEGNIFPKFELTGDSFYHGMNLGFETTW